MPRPHHKWGPEGHQPNQSHVSLCPSLEGTHERACSTLVPLIAANIYWGARDTREKRRLPLGSQIQQG